MSDNAETAILAGGCSWIMQQLLRHPDGVISTRVGWTGGEGDDPTEENPGGHAEAVEVVFDPERISYRDLLEYFFQVHRADLGERLVGSIYRSEIFYTSDEQRKVAEETIRDVDASGHWPGKVVTKISEAGPLLGGPRPKIRTTSSAIRTAARPPSRGTGWKLPTARPRPSSARWALSGTMGGASREGWRWLPGAEGRLVGVARGFGLEGASVAIGYRSSRSKAEEVVADLEGSGGQAHSGHLDVTDQDSVDAFVADVVERYGRLDVLVNAAGRLDEADTVRFSELDTAAASALLQVDVIGTMRICHAVRPKMLEGGGGAIVNFSSTYGNGINPDNAINFVPVTYSTAKGAIRGLTTTLARDLAPDIRVNALAPGPISGEWETEWGVTPEHIDEAIAMNPLKRFGKPEEIAETVLFLASDGAGYITGQVIHVDGGWVVAG